MRQIEKSTYPCQIFTIPEMIEPIGDLDKIKQFPNRIRRFIKRRLMYLRNWITVYKHEAKIKPEATLSKSNNHLQAGDWVFVKSRMDIRTTLNLWNKLGGCGFMEEMWLYCGTSQQVLKQVNQFLDERDYRVKRCKNTVILDGVYCSGTVDFGPCDRNCFFFWREEWLERLEKGELPHEHKSG